MIFKNISTAATPLRAALDGASRILLHLHPSPDADSVGSALACYHLLRSWGKEVVIAGGDSPLPENFSVLPGADQISAQDLVSLDLKNFDLFLILDSADRKRLSRRGELSFPSPLRTVAIDHHRSHQVFAELTLCLPEAPATAMILYELFLAWKIDWTPAIAAGLLGGLYGDTGGFRYPATTPATLAAAGDLAKHYPHFANLWFELGRPTAGEIRFKKLALENLESWSGDRVAAFVLSHGALVEANLSEDDVSTGGVVSYLASARGQLLAVGATEAAPGEIRVSLRTSQPNLDVAAVAAALGGGGHRAAAGAFITGSTIERVKADLRARIDELLN